MQCFNEQESRGGRRRKLYADTFRANPKFANAQHVRRVHQLIELWESEMLKILVESKNEND